MDTHAELARISSLVDQEPRLRGAFSADPQAIWIPFAGEPKKRCLFLGLFVVEKLLKRAAITSVCTRAIEALNAGQALKGADALEIMLCVARGGTAERVLRLQVLASAFTTAELLTPTDLDLKQPMEGVTCSLYRRALA